MRTTAFINSQQYRDFGQKRTQMKTAVSQKRFNLNLNEWVDHFFSLMKGLACLVLHKNLSEYLTNFLVKVKIFNSRVIKKINVN